MRGLRSQHWLEILRACQEDRSHNFGTTLSGGALGFGVSWYLLLKWAPKPPSDRLVERAGRKPEADRRLYERLRSVDDAARDSAAGASGCRKQQARPCQTC
jgi:hypothetical protein